MSADFDRGWDAALNAVIKKIDEDIDLGNKRLRGEVETALSKDRIEGFVADLGYLADKVEQWLVTPRDPNTKKGK